MDMDIRNRNCGYWQQHRNSNIACINHIFQQYTGSLRNAVTKLLDSEKTR